MTVVASSPRLNMEYPPHGPYDRQFVNLRETGEGRMKDDRPALAARHAAPRPCGPPPRTFSYMQLGHAIATDGRTFFEWNQ